MNKSRLYNIFPLLCLVLLAIGLPSCVDDFPVPSGWDETYDDADEVTLPVALEVKPMKSVDPASRAVSYMEATLEEKAIADVWIIQYNEEGNRVGLPKYYEWKNGAVEWKDETEISDLIVSQDMKVLVPREDDHQYTVVVLANTHNGNLFNPDNRSKFSTLDSLRNFDIIIHNQEDLFDPDPEDHHEYKYLLMSGWTKVDKNTTGLQVPLIRNTCKVNVKLTNFFSYDPYDPDDSTRGLTLKYYQWVDLPMGKLFPHGKNENYHETLSLDFRMHNEEDRLGALQEEGVTFWLPCNVWLPEDDLMDGSDTSPAAVDNKIDSDREEIPTHFDIVCRKNDPEDLNLYEFRIYPSRDTTKQFDFVPNHFYQIEVDISQIPEKENGFFKITVFKDLGTSNSFILKQDTKGVYTIPVDRINVFWGYFDSDNMLNEDTEWVAEVIWQDTDQRVVDFAINTTGEISPDRSRYFGQGNTALAFRTTGTGLGNVIVGVRPKKDGEEEWSKVKLDEEYPPEGREYLWSWHLWITDYDPDMSKDQSSAEVNWAIQVPGGQVIQMGINKMMDRNLGAWAPEVNNPMNPEDIIKTFGLYYQYGRKDPFPYFNPDRVGVYDIDGNKIPAFNGQEVSFEVTTRVPELNPDGSDKKDNKGNSVYDYITDYRTEKITMMSSAVSEDYGVGTFANGVLKPYMFWADVNETYNWASDVGNVSIIGGWYMTEGYQGFMDKDMKDIFDPCPPGWVMDSSTGDFYGGLGEVELFYGQQEYLEWKGFINSDDKEGQSVKFEDTEENRAKIKEYHKLEEEFWEDLNGENVSISGAPTAFMGSYLYYRDKPGRSYFPAAGSRNKYGGGDRFHNYMCLPWGNNMIRLTSFGFHLIEGGSDESKKFYGEEFSTATAMQVRCVRL